MKSSLVIKIVFKLFLINLLTLAGILLLDLVPYYRIVGILVILFISFISSIVIIWGTVLHPLRSLVKSVKPLNFELDTIDFTKLDNFSYSNNDDIGFLTEKFKYLSDILVARVDRVNTVTYKSEHDALSGLYNREKYQKTKGIYAGCDDICIIYIDVNNLKKMNDIFGHEAGDALIKKSAFKLDYWSSIGDVYRMGGDEFMIVITNYSRFDCERMIDEWYPTVGCLNRADDGFKCMMAYGVAYGKKFCDIDSLVKEADEKMYNHKIEIKKSNGEDPNSR